MKIFITGDLGKLGRRIAHLLVKDHQVVGYDWTSDPAQDIRDLDRLIAAMQKYGCDCVVHAAGIPHPKQGGIGNYFDVNVKGSFNVFAAAEHCMVQRVVYLSSTGFYGCDMKGFLTPAYFPIDEAHPIASQPGQGLGKLSAYNQSKVMAEQALAWFGTNGVFEAIALRLAPANPKSWQYDGAYTWRDHCESYRKTGDNWIRGCFFSNCDPEYVASAVELAVQSSHSFGYEPFNICDLYTHRDVDVQKFIAQEYPGIRLQKELGPHDSLISCRKAMEVLGYEPCTDLE